MPPSRNTESPSKDDPHAFDPFRSFTRFVDERISYMLQSVIGLPSSKEDVKSWRPREELQRKDQHPWGWSHDVQRKQYELEDDTDRHLPNSRLATSSNQSPKIARETDSSSPTPTGQATQASHFESQDEPDYISYQYNNPYEMLPYALVAMPDSAIDDSVERCSGGEALSRLEDFLNHSSYSPTNLEKNPDLQSISRNWRREFTDLMNETTGGPLPYLTQNKYLTTTRLEENTWKSFFLMNFGYNFYVNAMRKDLTTGAATALLDPMALAILLRSVQTMSTDIERHERLFRAGMERFHPERLDNMLDEYENVPFQVKSQHREEDEQDDIDGDEEHEEMDDNGDEEPDFETELDMIEGMIKGMFNHPFQDRQDLTASQATKKALTESERPSIISRLTNVERFVSADGTVETRRVLKTRFSDGTEDIEESRDVKAGSGQVKLTDDSSPETLRDTDKSKIVHDSIKSNDAKKSGWFWK